MHSVVTFFATVNSQPHAGSRQGCIFVEADGTGVLGAMSAAGLERNYPLSRRTAQGCRPYRDNVRSLCNNLIINMVHWFKPQPRCPPTILASQ